jgi:hypothetical protein
MSKYEPLPQFLASVGSTAHRMSFSQIERVLGFKLPKNADLTAPTGEKWNAEEGRLLNE